ncbi:MAG: cupin domain-containing protein [Rhodospirillales bacterium]
MNEAEFRAAAEQGGFEVPVAKSKAANLFNDTHTHDDDVFLFVTGGEIVIELGEERHVCGPGDAIMVAGNAPHTERVSADGVFYLSTRRAART